MKQVTIRQLVRQGSKSKLEEWMPCEIVSDGEVIALLSLPLDVVKHDVRQLKFSKIKQASGKM